MRALLLLLLCAPLRAADMSLETIREKHGLPGMARARLQDGKLSVEVSGVRRFGEPASVRPGDQWHLGSCTKAMTATLVALFAERGLLRWNETLPELFPQLDLDPAYGKVTLEMLLAHRAGLAGDLLAYDGGKLWGRLWEPGLDPSEGRALVAKTMLEAPPASPPGSRYEYSNADYIIAGAVLERAAETSWENIIRKELFRPLGMNCGFGPAGGHVREGGAWTPVNKDNPPALGPAGTVHCDLASWAKFAQLHLDGDAGRPTPILHPASFAKLHAAYPGQEYTYGGWIRVSRPWAGKRGLALNHVGSNTMNTADIWLAPERNLALLSTANAAGPEASAAVDEAVGSLIP
ncbi:MAG TPA: serine hydrolase domain-containing protein [Elusimicrobiota bacterium]|nr:serine hydrolase domain-containing protein [Elusimicrobiota bacterium]